MTDAREIASQIIELSEKAMPGPWALSKMVKGDSPTSYWVEQLPADVRVIDSHGTAFALGVNVCALPDRSRDAGSWDDAAFICYARNHASALARAYLSLLDERARLARERDELKTALDRRRELDCEQCP